MTTTESINNIIRAHTEAIADLETLSAIVNELNGMVESPTTSDLYEYDYEGDDFVPKLINPRAPQIVADIIDLISEHYLLAINFPVETVPDDAPMEKVFITPREG